MNWIVEERKNNANSAFVAHLNINSIQNKFEELKLLNNLLKAQIFIVSETKLSHVLTLTTSLDYRDTRCIVET